MRGLYLTSDLMFSSRVLGIARDNGWRVDAVLNAESLAERLAGGDVLLVMIDLTAAGCDPASLVPTIHAAAAAARIVAYGPHVDESRLAAARQAGCHEVLSRGQFMQAFPAILRESLEPRAEQA